VRPERVNKWPNRYMMMMMMMMMMVVVVVARIQECWQRRKDAAERSHKEWKKFNVEKLYILMQCSKG